MQIAILMCYQNGMKFHYYWSMHIKSDGFKLSWIIKFAQFVTIDNITYVKPWGNDSLMWTRTLDVDPTTLLRATFAFLNHYFIFKTFLESF